jgi:hypothetical protein
MNKLYVEGSFGCTYTCASGHDASNSVALAVPGSCLGTQIYALFLHTATCPIGVCSGAKPDKFQLRAGATRVVQNRCRRMVDIVVSRMCKVIISVEQGSSYSVYRQ